MNSELFELALSATLKDRNTPLGAPIPGIGVKKISGRAMPYSLRHRGQWFVPEYIDNIKEIQIAQDTDAYLFKAIQKKVNGFLLAGYEITGENKEVVSYLKKRLSEMENVSGTPFELLMIQTAHDLFRYSNCMWVKVRNNDASTGKTRKSPTGQKLDPIAGYFILPFETLEFKTTVSGEIKKVLQRMPGTGQTKEFSKNDVIHFYTNKKPGFSMGTPEVLPALDDIALLRRLEEQIEQLIDSSLHPLFHYTVGSDNLPERYSPEGIKETDIVKKTIEYMPAGGIYVSDHRHKIEAIGSEGRALRAESYLEYFKKRVFAALDVGPVDFGEGDTSNRATALVMSKSASKAVEACQKQMKIFIQSYVFKEILLEGGYNVMDPDNRVEIKFGGVDKEDIAKQENQTIQLWLNNLINENEARKRLRLEPMTEEQRESNHYKLYEEPTSMLKNLNIASAGEALANASNSAITSEGIAKQREQEQEIAKAKGQSLQSKANGAENTSNNKARPSNQHGTRTSPKFTKDYKNLDILERSFLDGYEKLCFNKKLDFYPNELVSLKNEYDKELNDIHKLSKIRINEFENSGISKETLLESLQWRYEELNRKFSVSAYNLGNEIAKLAFKE